MLCNVLAGLLGSHSYKTYDSERRPDTERSDDLALFIIV